LFSTADLELIRWTAERFPGLSLKELAQTICENLPWKVPNGELKVHACPALLEQWSAPGLVPLPARCAHEPYRRARLPVAAEEQAVGDATMAALHAMGFQRAFGAHQRYWIRGQVAGASR
jgi:hypothetical protein